MRNFLLFTALVVRLNKVQAKFEIWSRVASTRMDAGFSAVSLAALLHWLHRTKVGDSLQDEAGSRQGKAVGE